MRIFITGASGWIGSATVPELIGAGHQVIGLGRSDSSAAALAAAGAEVQRGSLDDLDALRAGAAASDGVIHLAFKHEEAFSGDFEGAARADRHAIEAMGEVLAGSGRPLVIASGTAAVSPGRVATETDTPDPGHALHVRMLSEQLVLSLASRGVRSSSVRLSPSVHGEGDNGFMAMLLASARDKGVAAFIGDGANRWPAVHRLDAARLFRLAVEGAMAGSVLHGVGDEGVPLKAVAEVIGRHLELPVVSITPDEAGDHFGWLAGLLAADIPASSALTRERLQWQPIHPGLLADLDAGHYFGMPNV